METEPTAARPAGYAGGPPPSDRPEIAHVLFMDVVAFTTLPMEEQWEVLKQLQEIVRAAPAFCAAERDQQLIRLPTGDGMALAFFGDPISAVDCALEISAQLASHPNLKLRMGINTGLVYRHLDINANLNVQGGGINEAQRIMDAGDAGHILVSKQTAALLLHLKKWTPQLHDLGEHAVKHGKKLHFYNLYTGELGNPALPAKFRAERTRATRVRRARWAAAATVVALLVAAGVIVSHWLAPARLQRVAVMGFRNLGPRTAADGMSAFLAEGIRTELGSTGQLEMVASQECTDIWRDLGLPEIQSMDRRTLARLHRRNVDLVVIGSFNSMPDGHVHLNVEVQDTRNGATKFALPIDADLSGLIKQTGLLLRAKMKLEPLSSEREMQLRMSEVSGMAAEPYGEGIKWLRLYEPMKAQSYLQKAVNMDASSPVVHSALAEAWWLLGYDQRARDEARQAKDESSELLYELRKAIEGQYYGMVADWQKSIDVYKDLFDHFPQHLEYGLRLAAAQREAGKGKDALATLASMRTKLQGIDKDDPRIDLEEAETSKSLGDLRRAQNAAERAADKAVHLDARLLAGRSLTWACTALRDLGQSQKAIPKCEEARKISEAIGDDLGKARAATGLGIIYRNQGRLDLAKPLMEEALKTARGIGAQKDVSGALNNLGMILDSQGDLQGAKHYYQEALVIQKEIGNQAESAGTLNNLGGVVQRLGDLDQAQTILERAIEAAQQSGSQRTQADALASLGGVLFARGKLSEARKAYDQAVPMQRDHGTKKNLADTLDGFGDLLVASGDLQGAAQRYNEALSFQEGIDAATSRLGLATVLLEQGQVAKAETGIRAALDEFHSNGDTDDEAFARVLLVRALFEQGKIREAQEHIGQLSKIAASASDRSLRFGASIILSRVRSAIDKSSTAEVLAELDRVAQEAKRAGMPGPYLEARLAIGEIELAQGRNAQGQRDLSSLHQEALASGFVAIAAKAAVAK